MSSVKTANERKADERARMRTRGYVLKQFWVHSDDWEQAQKYLARINKAREKSKAMGCRG
jgi:hypothetical protein